MRYADVIVSVASRKIDRPFRYLVPDEEGFEDLGIGHLVEVPFGNRSVPGFVVALTDDPPQDFDADVELKPILQVISGPHFDQRAVAIAEWMSEYYASPLANCLNLFTPPLGRNWRKAVKRRPRNDDELPATEAPRHEHLTAGQVASLEAIEHLAGGEILLLDGVTGSGKTEVYLRAIEDTLDRDKGAIVLVPEISLTPQTVGRFRARFGDLISVLHSRLTEAQRAYQLERLRKGETRVVIGPRSALFAPVSDLGMIIIDEEHDHSYKQESDPRYHARRVAQRMAQLSDARLILGSATPSFETLEQVREGSIERIELPQRVNEQPLPPVEVVDMTEEFEAGNRSMFSRVLQEYLEQVKKKKQKAIILLNRRGFANFVLCRECGYVPMCESCDTSLTLHKTHGKLQCHHCGRLEQIPPKCPLCDSPYIASFGAGTQRVEFELNKLFEDWPIVRMDADTTAGRMGHQEQLNAFEALETGVLVGTQMIAKGLDFPEVTLVGIMAADSSLNIPEFTSSERTYQLLEQVAGRAGRGAEEGHVVIQTYQSEHPAIRAATEHDRSIILDQDLAMREELGYPPYTSMANIVISSTDESKAEDAASFIADAVESRFKESSTQLVSLLGPIPCALSKLKGRFRFHILLKGQRNDELGPPIMEALKELTFPTDVRVTVDIDPQSLG